MQGWDNESSSSLQAAGAADYWGNSFCTAHHVGTWCSGFTQVRCCRASWGFVRCGSTVHSRRCGWHVNGWHAPGWHYDQEDKTAYLEEPSQEQDENPKQAMQGWDNESSSSLQAAGAADYWGNSFCTAHHVGTWCSGFTQVRCCGASWGFVRCGSTVHSQRCGWHVSGWHAAGWHYDQEETQDADVFPDENTGFDDVGPFAEEPSQEQEENPQKAISGWDNETALKAAGSFDKWGRSFCSAHRVGTFCDKFSQVRCCRASWGGFVKCGSTVHASRCGWTGGAGGVAGGSAGGSAGGAAWVIHPGWRQSGFCRAHRVGFFCSSHRKIQCCNDRGHYVECTTSVQRRYRC